jgi:hypothetical protein
MKTSSAAKPVSRASARNFFVLNQFATPGLGSIMAGRRIAGAGQLLLAVAGFVLVILWFVKTVVQSYNEVIGGIPPQSRGWFGAAGVLVFATSWLWALVTSLQILRAAKQDEPPGVPPRLNP